MPHLVCAGLGDDKIVTGAGDDEILAGPGNDIVNGGPGNDGLFGGQNSDLINGGPGDDLLVGDIPDRESEDGLPPTVDPTLHFDTCIGAGGADQALTCERHRRYLAADCRPLPWSRSSAIEAGGQPRPGVQPPGIPRS